MNVETSSDSQGCGTEYTAIVTGGTGPYSYDWGVQEWMDVIGSGNSANITGGYGLVTLEVTDIGTGCVVNVELMLIGSGCAVDFNGDGLVGLADLLEFIGNYSTTGGSCYDLNGDAIVGVTDLLIFMAAYGLTGC
jgi:hypothetical protein